ncbi:acyl carrier protein [Micromonospora sp. NPDC023644]|uniref:acyl carrier protein n=1 Tax=Micromonospora sp. NPDC023644 TaxID=3154321 RepID=UPI0033D7EF1E
MESTHADTVIDEETLDVVVKRVLAVPPPGAAPHYTAAMQLAELEIDSLVVAELIVEFEQVLGVLLDVVAVDRMETLGDLCRALRPAAG